MEKYAHHVVPFLGQVNTGVLTSEGVDRVSGQLRKIINHYAVHGWEFHQLARVTVKVNPGCLASLFGHGVSYLTSDQLVLRRLRPEVAASDEGSVQPVEQPVDEAPRAGAAASETP